MVDLIMIKIVSINEWLFVITLPNPCDYRAQRTGVIKFD